MTAEEAFERLKQGNKDYISAQKGVGDVSPAMRENTAKNGQRPYAVIVCCSDSRVIPEAIFSAGIGELFVIRVAGNVIGDHALGSIDYAVSHLGCKLVLVLGHNHCGAVGAAVSGHAEGLVKSITDEILAVAGSERNEDEVCKLNVLHSVRNVSKKLNAEKDSKLKIVGGIYLLESGRVQFL